jgi:hypothetical protein
MDRIAEVDGEQLHLSLTRAASASAGR